MSDRQTSDIEQLIGQLEPESNLRRKSGLLRPLNLSLLILCLAGLALMPLTSAGPGDYAFVSLSLLLLGGIAWLERRGRVEVAVLIFCQYINAGILVLIGLNLFREANIALGLVFACVLAMSVMLAGMLLGRGQSLAFAVGNGAAVSALLYAYYGRLVGEPAGEAARSTISAVVPVASFLIFIAVISWLYQRALSQAEQRVGLARQRILRDELLRRDLAIARELQQRLYPPPPLTNANLRIASRSEPARETSGDFYDFIQLGEGRLGIVVADVTGKSIAAALVMAMARGTLRAEATRQLSPAEVLGSANRTLCEDHSVRQMITAFYGVLDTQTLTLRLSNAGHPFPVLRRAGQLEEIEVCGLPLGARHDALYSERSLQLQPGDQLVLLSDGLLEERNARRELFGFDRLTEAIGAAASDDPEHALDDIWQAVTEFRGEAEQSDDFTLVVIQVAAALELAPSAARVPQAAG